MTTQATFYLVDHMSLLYSSSLEKYLFNKETIINDTQIKMYINSYFIFIINLDKDVIRRQYIKLLMKKMNINYNLIIVKPITKELFEETLKYSKFKMRISEMGCCLSHLWCLNYAIQQNISKLVLFFTPLTVHTYQRRLNCI